MNKSILIQTVLMLIATISNGQLIEKILEKSNPWVQDVLTKHEQYEVQIIYSQITRDEQGLPTIESHEFGIDEARYFYPASTVKLPVALFALEKLNELNDERLTQNTPMAFGSVRSPQLAVSMDKSAKDELLTIDHLVKKVFLVSDNDAYNLLYSFCGHDYVKNKLEMKGFSKARIGDRVGAGSFSHEDNKSTNSFLFYEDKEILYAEPGQTGVLEYNLVLKNCIKGKGYLSNGERINQPFNFCEKNFISLPTLHDMLVSVVLPDAVTEQARLNVTKDQRNAILSYMSARPRESKFPTYPDDYYDSFVKFLVVGDDTSRMSDDLRIFNKVGNAYGYLTDVAYVVDLNLGIEFVLAATIHVNENQIFNDDTYEYETVGIPFLAEIGRLFYEHEKTRNHTFDPTELKKLVYD